MFKNVLIEIIKHPNTRFEMVQRMLRESWVAWNLALKKREDELLLSISELEAKKAELQKTTDELQHSAEVHENSLYNDNLEIKHEQVIFTNDIFIPPSNMAINYHQNEDENEMHTQVKPSSRTLIFDTKDLFSCQQDSIWTNYLMHDS